MRADLFPLQVLFVTLAGWVNRHQQHVIEYLVEENRVLEEQVKGRRLRLTDDQRRRLILRMTTENPGWGYTRIQGALKNLGHEVARSTVAKVLGAALRRSLVPRCQLARLTSLAARIGGRRLH
jgi:hypothetical protein